MAATVAPSSTIHESHAREQGRSSVSCLGHTRQGCASNSPPHSCVGKSPERARSPEPPSTGLGLRRSAWRIVVGLPARGWVTSVADDAVVGCVGTVVTRIRGADGPGEVTVAVRGGHETFIAFADEPIDKHADVLVVRSRGPRAVDVQPWA